MAAKSCCKFCCKRECKCSTNKPRSVPISWSDKRDTAAQRGYGYKWKRARLVFLRNNPLCIECLRADKVTPGFAVDHIEPHRGDMILFWDVDNWQTLCEKCHNTKTGLGK